MSIMKKENIMPAAVLSAICLIVALLLSAVNLVTGPVIKENQEAAANEALLIVLPEGKNFEKITLDEKYPPIITAAYKADGGFVFQADVTGKSSGLIIMCGINTEGKIVGTKVIAEQETDTYDANVFPYVEGLDGEYSGMGLDNFEPYLVSGATLTSKAYGDAVKAALQSFVIASGGSVDIRTPEQIIQDNCNTALGTEGVKFTKWFATEIIEGIDAVYEAEGGAGRVFVIGESFIAVKNGAAIGGGESSAAVEAADAVISASTLTEIQKPADANRAIDKIFVTASGNYIFELSASGYQALIEWGDGTPIKIKLSISADGKIIDVLTVSHGESKGYGDTCATEEYYEQYRGQAGEDIKLSSGTPDYHEDLIPSGSTDIGAISSATYTTYGYQKAIKAAFDTFEVLTGGNQ